MFAWVTAPCSAVLGWWMCAKPAWLHSIVLTIILFVIGFLASIECWRIYDSNFQKNDKSLSWIVNILNIWRTDDIVHFLLIYYTVTLSIIGHHIYILGLVGRYGVNKIFIDSTFNFEILNMGDEWTRYEFLVIAFFVNCVQLYLLYF